MGSINRARWLGTVGCHGVEAALVGNGLRLRRRLAGAAGPATRADAAADRADLGRPRRGPGRGPRPSLRRTLRRRGRPPAGRPASRRSTSVPGDLPVEELLDQLRIADPVRAAREPDLPGLRGRAGGGPDPWPGRAGRDRRRGRPTPSRCGGRSPRPSVRARTASTRRSRPGCGPCRCASTRTCRCGATEYGRPLPPIVADPGRAPRWGPPRLAAAAGGSRRRSPWRRRPPPSRRSSPPARRARPATGGRRPPARPAVVGTVRRPRSAARAAGGGPSQPAHTDPQFITEAPAAPTRPTWRRRRPVPRLRARRLPGVRQHGHPTPAAGARHDPVQAGHVPGRRVRRLSDELPEPAAHARGPGLLLPRLLRRLRARCDTEMMFSADWPALPAAGAGSCDGFAEPRRWLDVGGGHGHFCLVASSRVPRHPVRAARPADAVAEARAGAAGSPTATARTFPEARPRVARRLVRRGQHVPLPRAHDRPAGRARRRRAGARARRAPDHRGAGARLPAGVAGSAGPGAPGCSPSTSTCCRSTRWWTSSNGRGFEVVARRAAGARASHGTLVGLVPAPTRLVPGPNAPWTGPLPQPTGWPAWRGWPRGRR